MMRFITAAFRPARLLDIQGMGQRLNTVNTTARTNQQIESLTNTNATTPPTAEVQAEAQHMLTNLVEISHMPETQGADLQNVTSLIHHLQGGGAFGPEQQGQCEAITQHLQDRIGAELQQATAGHAAGTTTGESGRRMYLPSGQTEPVASTPPSTTTPPEPTPPPTTGGSGRRTYVQSGEI